MSGGWHRGCNLRRRAIGGICVRAGERRDETRLAGKQDALLAKRVCMKPVCPMISPQVLNPATPLNHNRAMPPRVDAKGHAHGHNGVQPLSKCVARGAE